MTKFSYFLLLGAVLAPLSAHAGGFQLSEYSTTNLGRSFAGTTVVGDDLSAIAFNPSGMILNQSAAQINATYVHLRGKAEDLTDPSHDKGKIRADKALPAMFAQYALDDNSRIGFGVYVPFGLGTDYELPWFGSDEADKSYIEVVDYNLALAHRLSSKLTVGASVIFETLKAHLSNTSGSGAAYSNMKADSTDLLWQVGALYEFSQNTRLAVSYRPKSVHELRGHHSFNYDARYGDCGTKLQFPESAYLSLMHRLNKVTLSATARWTRWSRFDILDIWSTAFTPGTRTPVGAVNENWKDVWMFSLGADYQLNDKWTVRGGVAYDKTPIRKAEYRTARIPDNNRVILSLGTSYQTGNWQFDAGVSHLLFRKSQENRSNLKAEYTMNTEMLSLGVQYKF